MTQLLIYSEDGSTCPGTTYDANMVSRLDRREAHETWQVGYVGDALAIRLKTVSSLNTLLRKAIDGDVVEVSYRSPVGTIIRESRTVRLTGHRIQPVLMARDDTAYSDAQVVSLIGARWGEYITVRYRLLTSQGAALLPIPELADPARGDLRAAALR